MRSPAVRLIDSEQQQRAPDSPGAAALYIGAFAEELARLAKNHHLETLAYLLDMARLEADQISKHSEKRAAVESRRAR